MVLALKSRRESGRRFGRLDGGGAEVRLVELVEADRLTWRDVIATSRRKSVECLGITGSRVGSVFWYP